jgi:hypothetical protein
LTISFPSLHRHYTRPDKVSRPTPSARRTLFTHNPPLRRFFQKVSQDLLGVALTLKCIPFAMVPEEL